MVEVSEYLREELDRAHILPAEKLRPDIVNLDSRSNFVTSKPGRFRKSSWFIRLMLTLLAGACRS